MLTINMYQFKYTIHTSSLDDFDDVPAGCLNISFI